MSVPGQSEMIPEKHPQNRILSYLGSGLSDVECYEDLFLMDRIDNNC